MKIRRLASLILLISFILTLITSIVLYIMPHGRVAYWAGWHLAGLDKHQWSAMHINLGILFILSGIMHIAYNWKGITTYISRNTGREFLFAIITSFIFIIGTYMNLPPWSTVIHIQDMIKAKASEKYGEPPYGHAELSSLRLLCKRMDINTQQALTRLTQAGIKHVSPEQSIERIALSNHMKPKDIYAIIKPSRSSLHGRFPRFPFPGFGKKTLEEICNTYGLSLPDIMEAMQIRGIDANRKETIKEIAHRNGIRPFSLFEIISEEAMKQQSH